MKMINLASLLDDTRRDAPLRVVICGEVNSGKSTVMNALMRDQLLPDNIGQATRPVLVAGWRGVAGIEALDHEGRDLPAATSTPSFWHEAGFVRLWTPLPHMSGIELVELPLTHAGELTETQIAIVASSDVLIWTTIASQAWRLTEKTLLEALGGACPARAVLAVTRGDKLRNARDRERQMERLERETSALFSHRLYLYGDRRRIAASTLSDTEWEATGAAQLAAMLHGFALEIARDPAIPPDGPPAGSRPMKVAPTRRQISPVPLIAAEGVMSEILSARPGQDGVILAGRVAGPGTGAGTGPGGAGEILPLTGEAGLVCRLGALCEQIRNTLGTVRGGEAEGGPISAFGLSTTRYRLMFQITGGGGLVFLLADAGRMTQGLAQMRLQQFSAPGIPD